MKKSLPIIIILAIGIIMFFVFKPEVQRTPVTDLQNNSNTMNISSTAFGHNEKIPSKYTCDGKNINPPLTIANVPKNTKSLALIMDDPDALSGTWVHWISWNIDPETTAIYEKSILGVEGITSFGKAGYGGPCPPAGTHHYSFRLYALDTMLDLTEGSTIADLIKAMQGHILDQSELVGLYQHL